jgi:sulfide dehydrogenase cytochrome subunit
MDGLDRPRRSIPGLPLAALALCAALAACGGGSSAPDAESTATQERASSSSASPTAAPLAASPEGRLLASNCFQCHGTNGSGGFEDIRGESAEELLEFLQKPAGKDIMAAHAQGYTPAQLKTIAAYLQR